MVASFKRPFAYIYTFFPLSRRLGLDLYSVGGAGEEGDLKMTVK